MVFDCLFQLLVENGAALRSKGCSNHGTRGTAKTVGGRTVLTGVAIDGVSHGAELGDTSRYGTFGGTELLGDGRGRELLTGFQNVQYFSLNRHYKFPYVKYAPPQKRV